MLHIFILAFLVKLLADNGKPFLCAGIYASLTFLFGLLVVAADGFTFAALLLLTAMRFGYVSLFFWLVNRIGGGMIWWAVVLGGIFIGVFTGLA